MLGKYGNWLYFPLKRLAVMLCWAFCVQPGSGEITVNAMFFAGYPVKF